MREKVVIAALLVCTACAGGVGVARLASTLQGRPSPSPSGAPPSPSIPASPSPAPATPAHGTAAPAPARTAAAPPAAPAPCPVNLASQLAGNGGGRQVITVDAASSASTSATLALWQRSGSCWGLVAGPWTARVGSNGVSDHHREGDDTTPAGRYGFGPVMYGIAASPGVAYPYHQLTCGDWWDEDPASPSYNTFQHVACGSAPSFHGGSEALWQMTVAYQRFAVIGYNAGPIVAGAGSAVFLHDDTGRPTAGCVSLPAGQLDTVLRWLNPSASPRVVIGTDAEIRRF